MSLARDVIARLRAALAVVADARTGASAARETAAELQTEVHAATDGTGDEKPAEVIVRLQQAQVRLDEAIAEFAAGSAAVEAYIADGLGGEGASETGSSPPAAAPARSAAKPFNPRRRNRGHREDDIRSLGWPKNDQGRISARGRLYDENGDRLSDKVWTADPDIHHDDLREPWASHPDYVTRWHVEGQVAAWMRDTGRREAVLYLNIPACGASNYNPARCHMNLPKHLPQDATLHVHAVFEDGGYFKCSYTGTGEAIVK